MKLLHTSDLLIGLGFPQLPELASALRETRLEALRSVLALASRSAWLKPAHFLASAEALCVKML